ncbi:MAG TPA: endonuclease domain-containing protein [Armatimonadota bacterium]|nr:endonuclease domain-containing protein [Armatimonadota bacterium]
MGRPSVNRARRLRRAPTTAEKILWRHLRNERLNERKWRRQQPIDQYIVDFFCPELRLVVELDGGIHAFQERRDEARQAYLEAQGLKIVRFTNEDVLGNLEGVLTTLWHLTCQDDAEITANTGDNPLTLALCYSAKSLRSTSPARGEGKNPRAKGSRR